MDNTGLNTEDTLPIHNESKTALNDSGRSIAKITKNIGQGEDAKNSIIYLTIKYTFITGIVFTSIICINHWVDKYNQIDVKSETIVDSLQKAWQILIPIVTLALGYAFGKSQK